MPKNFLLLIKDFIFIASNYKWVYLSVHSDNLYCFITSSERFQFNLNC